jgi:Cdc6-like AAA superfamily ATPase
MTRFEGLRTLRIAPLTGANLRLVLEDMQKGPGWIPSADLYRHYVWMCEEDNLDPMNQNSFGRELTKMGYRQEVKRIDGKLVRGRFISNKAFRAEVDE